MVTPIRTFVNDSIFHIYNRGVEKRTTFVTPDDYQRFLDSLFHYQQRRAEARQFSLSHHEPEDRRRPFRFELLAYCLMTNHFHLVVRQTEEGGISSAMGQLLNSYTKYFNTKYQRVGHLWQGRFQAVPVVDDDQFVHVVRYALINPHVAGLTTDVLAYPYSSIREATSEHSSPKDLTDTKLWRSYFRNRSQLLSFILDYADEARSRELLQKHLIDE